MKFVFEYKDYKAYLTGVMGGGGRRSGQRARLAQHLGCQTAYISQVLNGHQHLSSEQAFKASGFFGHDREESHFFQLLVLSARAGTVELKEYYSEQIREILNRRTLIKNRVSSNREVPAEHQSKYYSSWHYIAVHMALSVPELQTKEALAEYFRLPLVEVAKTLEFLVSAGLAEMQQGRYSVGPLHIHLGNDADNINKHHTNWRVQAIDSLSRSRSDDLHYSVVFSLSRADAEKFRERFLDLIKTNIKDVGPSREECLYVTCLDFFEARK
jgi:uncharacterized protein (TIGR02147 family)